jgi:hypothetical protein
MRVPNPTRIRRQGTLLALMSFTLAVPAHSWTSVKGPFSDEIHQTAIDNVLTPSMSPADRGILKNQQALVDKDQDADQSAEHAMTGVIKGSSYSAALKAKYVGLTEDLVHAALLDAIKDRKANQSTIALQSLGKAIHALEDSTSPVHEQFAVWSDDFGILEMAKHVAKERVYPNDDTPKRYQSHLEGAVGYAYAIYTEAVPMPAHFFSPIDGNLIIPASYLHVYTHP